KSAVRGPGLHWESAASALGGMREQVHSRAARNGLPGDFAALASSGIWKQLRDRRLSGATAAHWPTAIRTGDGESNGATALTERTTSSEPPLVPRREHVNRRHPSTAAPGRWTP